MQVLVATKPVDFRKQADSLAALVQEALGADPFCGRRLRVPRQADRSREALVVGRHRHVPLTKRLEGGQFRWPPIEDGVMRLTPAQLAALLEGTEWARVGRARGRASEGRAMTLLTAFAAITACRFADARRPALRQENSGAESLLARRPRISNRARHDERRRHAAPRYRRFARVDPGGARGPCRSARGAQPDRRRARPARGPQREARAHRRRDPPRALRPQVRAHRPTTSWRSRWRSWRPRSPRPRPRPRRLIPRSRAERTKKRRASRNEKLDHLPHEEVVIEPESKVCPCCGGALHVIGEDVSKRLDKVPAKLTVIVTRRPKYACRTCEKTGADEVAGIIQAPAPARLIEGGLPTERLVADVVVSKYADHLPLYRQSQILARHGVKIERSTLAQWVGAAAAELQPLHDHLVGLLKASPKLFCDETRCPVLDPGRGKTKTGFMWAIARDDRPWGGTDPPAVAYTYAPGRGGEHAVKLLAGFTGVLQVDGYAVYKQLARPSTAGRRR